MIGFVGIWWILEYFEFILRGLIAFVEGFD